MHNLLFLELTWSLKRTTIITPDDMSAVTCEDLL